MGRLTAIDRAGGQADAGLVLAGGGARGAYTSGVLSVLLPQVGHEVRVIVGSSVGGVIAAHLAAHWNGDAAAPHDGGADVWRALGFHEVLAPLLSPGGARRLLGHVGGLLPIVPPHRPSVFDSSPLRATLPRLIPFDQLNANLQRERLVLGLAATCAHGQRPRVFCKGPGPQRTYDALRGIEYIPTQTIAPEHVMASAAIPALLPAIHVEEPAHAAGWYFDGAPTLNTPIKPALWLGAKRVLVIALSSIGRPTMPADVRRPDVFTGAFQFLHGALGDPLANDIRTLASTNAAITAGQDRVAGAARCRTSSSAPEDPAAIGRLASRIWRQHYGRPGRGGARRDLWLLGQLLDAGADATRRAAELPVLRTRVRRRPHRPRPPRRPTLARPASRQPLAHHATAGMDRRGRAARVSRPAPRHCARRHLSPALKSPHGDVEAGEAHRRERWDDMQMRVRSRVMIGLGAANLTVGAAMLPSELRMRGAAGRGIVALEFAGSERRARALIRAWGRDGRAAARRLQWLDFAYLATYAPFLRLAALAAGERLARRGRDRWAATAPALARAQLAAGAFDAVENAALLGVLANARGDGLPRLAFGCAAIKFALLAAGWVLLAAAVGLPRSTSSSTGPLTAEVPSDAATG